jgi:phosphatidylglycerol:prolipoprotein diacylglycerol transferase
MYPQLTLGTFSVPSFALLVLLALALGSWLGARQARFLGYDADQVWRMIPWVAVAGVVGSKVYYLALIAREPVSRWIAAFPQSGMVWYGGAIAGVAMAAWRIRRTLGAPMHQLFDYGVPCLAAGHALGRIGCFLAGDDWGVPTTLPWGVAFPHGAPPSTAASLRAYGVSLPASVPDAQVFAVHPTMLYESAGLALLAWALWRMSRRAPRPWTVLAAYLVGYGALRFAVEILRAKDDRLPMGLTVAQLISVSLFLAGGAILALRRRDVRTSLPLHPPTTA